MYYAQKRGEKLFWPNLFFVWRDARALKKSEWEIETWLALSPSRLTSFRRTISPRGIKL
jgi:hypothetical protein